MKNGFCTIPNTCVCAPGWSGVNCDQCQKYPGCPGTCTKPWECNCSDDDENTNNKFCLIKDRSKITISSIGFTKFIPNESCHHYNLISANTTSAPIASTTPMTIVKTTKTIKQHVFKMKTHT